MTARAKATAQELLRLGGVTVRFGTAGRPALDAVDLDVAAHEIVCVLGPSGSGKSTLLRVVAGLQQADAGAVLLEGREQSGVPAHRRGVGLMFQDHQLFPQHDVEGNVAFGLRMRRSARAERERTVAGLLDLVGLPGAQRRAVASLSGGEQQRVALARALAPRPRLLMLDEPLGQLDRGLRERLVVELRRLFRELGTTVLAVTHDQGEAFALADRVVVMQDGRIAQTGTPLEVWQRPATEFVARFLGFDNVVAATVQGEAAATPWGKVPVADGTADGPCRLLVRPAGVRLTAAPEGLPCTVTARTFRGTHVALLLQPAAGPQVEAACALRDAPEVGERVGISFAAQDVVVLGAPDAAG
ncbi:MULTISPECIES: ABC transporter ATP-binding protein [unclassified Streptomyces]|uniref:ABC transporter ATP-binding protein n=1 Tax=unclassified Streptomyces TaxID=2593676 RepID=UPI0008821B13|nr:MULTISPECIES: ABC transporter ATP-binding protein [unclassified Streptomyces]PBC85347.1 thiamine transport system ATP-binding protein [Streptomyces sp. 2321.6]SDR17094.1 thiamine transport system ATP-binding protein [Streptomyces sp. KS_16]SED64898.1 thiamine transport system ATP-binding protein [Streptomyces sp. 2133.1]SNC71479.1 thiamine transport system ATP-binding protein [Streptomyces sp. 2114.4]